VPTFAALLSVLDRHQPDPTHPHFGERRCRACDNDAAVLIDGYCRDCHADVAAHVDARPCTPPPPPSAFFFGCGRGHHDAIDCEACQDRVWSAPAVPTVWNPERPTVRPAA
jgi:hypothetical protein